MSKGDSVFLQELVKNIQSDLGLSRSMTDPTAEIQADQLVNRFRCCIESFAERVSDLQTRNEELEVRLLQRERVLFEPASRKSEVYNQRTSVETKNRSELDLIDKKEVALRLNKSLRWVEQQCKAGFLPRIKINRSVFFDWDAVCSSLKARSSGGFVRRY